MEGNGLTTQLAKAGLAHHATDILRLARSAVRLEPSRCDSARLRAGASRFGGAPDLPADFVWPVHEGRPLAFLAQLDLATLPAVEGSDLPTRGSLAFFYEVESMKWGFAPEDRGCAHVAWLDGNPLVVTEPPRGCARFASCALAPAPSLDLPHLEDALLAPIAQQLPDERRDDYGELASSLYRMPYHHLVGHPQIVQRDMRVECELVTRGIDAGGAVDPEVMAACEPAARDWELLLQLDSDEDGPGWMWGDLGRIYFWIRRQDLAARRFDRVWLILQCS